MNKLEISIRTTSDIVLCGTFEVPENVGQQMITRLKRGEALRGEIGLRDADGHTHEFVRLSLIEYVEDPEKRAEEDRIREQMDRAELARLKAKYPEA